MRLRKQWSRRLEVVNGGIEDTPCFMMNRGSVHPLQLGGNVFGDGLERGSIRQQEHRTYGGDAIMV